MKRYSDFYNFLGWQKIHTIRANYDLWAKRIEQVQKWRSNYIIEILERKTLQHKTD